jgi:hypothetical protein
MPHTVAAIFENQSQADQARSELIKLGIPSDDIYVRDDSGQAQRTVSTQEEDDGGIGGFFKRLFGFGDEDPRATYYSQAIDEGRYLVALDTPSEDQAERAADLMRRLGALDIDDDIDDLSSGAGSGRRGVRVYARAHDIPAEEKTRLREEHAAGRSHMPGNAAGRAEQLAAEHKRQQHPHLETMEDDPYTESMFTKPRQQK